MRETARSRSGNDHLTAAIESMQRAWPTPDGTRCISRIGVVGAGTMGRGIATAGLLGGFEVVLVDVEADALARARTDIGRLISRAVDKGQLNAAKAEQANRRLVTADKLDALADAEIVIEAIIENIAAKQKLFSILDELTPADTLLATNTSTLDVQAIASATRRPGRVVGMHFFSPAHVMKLVEIVRTDEVSAESLGEACETARRMDKLPVIVGNAFGFVGNRMLYGYGRENQLLLLEGASPEAIDAALTSFGMAMGPNAVGDLTGLDIGYAVRRGWGERPDDPRYYRVADMLVERGRLGQKSGAGMFRYENGSREPQPDPEVAAMIAAEAGRLGIRQRSIGDDEIISRCITALVVEGCRLLERRIARCPADIDVIWTYGYGFPRQLGGPMHWADNKGLDVILARADEYAARVGEAYWSAPALLRRLATDGLALRSLDSEALA